MLNLTNLPQSHAQPLSARQLSRDFDDEDTAFEIKQSV